MNIHDVKTQHFKEMLYKAIILAMEIHEHGSCPFWLTMTSPDSGIYLIFGHGNTNTYCLESIYGHEYEYISFLAPEYEYNYPLGEVNMGPILNKARC